MALQRTLRKNVIYLFRFGDNKKRKKTKKTKTIFLSNNTKRRQLG